MSIRTGNVIASKTALVSFLGSTILTSMAAVSFASIATAQETAQQGALEEIVVTSRRYEESLQDAPVAVNVMSSNYLDSQGIDNVDQVVQFSPGASFVRFNKMQAEYSFRGVSSQSEGSSGDSSVQTIIDNVVISKDFMKNPAMFDVQRVEILRGPQGTSFGRNASAGLVHIITNRPTEEYESGINIGADTLNSFDVDGYVSGSISDNAQARLAVNYDYADGYTKRVSTGERLGGEENFAIRGSLNINMSDTVNLYLKAEYSKDDDETPVRRSRDCSFPTLDGTGATMPSPPHPPWDIIFTDSCNVWETEISDGEFFLKREMINLTAELTWDMSDSVTLTSVTGYIDGTNDYLIDAHGTPKDVMFQENHNTADMITQEIRIDNQASGEKFRWLVGGFYLEDNQTRFDENQFFQNNALGGPRIPTKDTRINENHTKSVGLFGEANIDVSERLEASFGLRWSEDDKDYKSLHSGFGWAPILEGFDDCAFIPPRGMFNCGTDDASRVGLLEFIPVSDSWSNVSLKASLQYELSDDKMIYALFSQGYKSGGFQNEPFTVADATTPFDKETATNYEVGFKGDFNDSFRLNVTGYKIKYDDLQIFQFVSLGETFAQRVSNLKGVDVYGLEIEGTWVVSDSFRISGNYSNIDSTLTDGTLVELDAESGPQDFSGTRPDNAPTWTATLAAEYDVRFDGGALLTIRGDWRGRSEVYDDIGEQAERLRPSANILGASLTWYSSDEDWSLSIWGRNLSNEEVVLNIGPPQPNTIQLPTAFGPPRSYGVNLRATF